MIDRQTVLADVVRILEELTADWDREAEIREDSEMLAELGLESIDLVALGAGIEETYRRSLPYPQFIIALTEQQRTDFTVGELVDFVVRELNAPSDGRAV